MDDAKLLEVRGPFGAELLKGLERHGLRVVRADDVGDALIARAYRDAFRRVAEKLGVNVADVGVKAMADDACNRVSRLVVLLSDARRETAQATNQADSWRKAFMASNARETYACDALGAKRGEGICDVADRIRREIAERDKTDEAAAMALEQKQDQADRLRTMVEKGRDTFADFERTLYALGRPVLAEAARVAAGAMTRALDADASKEAA